MDEKPKITIGKPTDDDELAGNLGIHVDYVEALSKGEPFGATVIEFPGRRHHHKKGE